MACLLVCVTLQCLFNSSHIFIQLSVFIYPNHLRPNLMNCQVISPWTYAFNHSCVTMTNTWAFNSRYLSVWWQSELVLGFTVGVLHLFVFYYGLDSETLVHLTFLFISVSVWFSGAAWHMEFGVETGNLLVVRQRILDPHAHFSSCFLCNGFQI